jgi:DNA modification methylase
VTLALHLGDCLDVMRTMADASVDAVVTDPPYGLSFMGKKWDYDVPSVEVWAECLRVLKPGGHLLAFAGTRTQHRMAVRIEDAGFEIRDMIAWVYGSGFPKSLDVSKAIDKCNGETGRLLKFTEWMRKTGLTARQADKITGTNMGGYYLTAASQPAIPTPALWALLRPHCGDVPEWVDELVRRIEAERQVIGKKKAAPGVAFSSDGPTELDITLPATDAARQWQGWGTALKPALEPITMARKPLEGTVAANVLAHGTGGLNVDGCRVGTERLPAMTAGQAQIGTFERGAMVTPEREGRWPANLIHSGEDEVVGLFPKNVKGQVGRSKTQGGHRFIEGDTESVQKFDQGTTDTGSAARFFYTAKASRDDRNDGNTHPTVKPTDLMRYLCRLVTPPGGIVLDPFMGSGSTGKAAMLEGFDFIGIEREPAYRAIASRRIRQAQAAGHQPDLFARVAA